MFSAIPATRLLILFPRLVFLLCVVAIILPAVQAQVPNTFHPPLAVLRSAHANGDVSESHAIQALWYAAAEVKVETQNIPRIIVIHGGNDVALAGAWTWTDKHASSGVVLIEPTTDGGKVYYLWIFGKPSDEILARGFVQILQKHIGSRDNDFATATKRVVSRLGSVVRADELQRGMFSGGDHP